MLSFGFTPFPIKLTERPRYSAIKITVRSHTQLDALCHAQRKVIIICDLNICPTWVDCTGQMNFPDNTEWNHRPTRIWIYRLIRQRNTIFYISFVKRILSNRIPSLCWLFTFNDPKSSTKSWVRRILYFTRRPWFRRASKSPPRPSAGRPIVEL